MRVGSLFTGYGGLDLAVEQFFGGSTVWTSDIDPGACKVIGHRWPGAPNLGDLTGVDWSAVEPIDVLTGGWPCQPFSLAGKRKGRADERALWPEVARAVRLLRPRFVVLENVAAITSDGELGRAVADLAALGYVGSWRCLRAADVGAPHGRARVFIVAADTGSSGWERRGADGVAGSCDTVAGGGGAFADAERGRRGGRAGEFGPGWREQPTYRGDAVADARRVARDEGRRGVAGGAREDRGPAGRAESVGRDRVSAIADADLGRLESVGRLDPVRRDLDRRGGAHVAWGDYEPAIRRWEAVIGRPAPAPTEVAPRGGKRLSPRFVEWMMGLPAGWVTDVPGLTRNVQLKALGNGVVPQQAVAALGMMTYRNLD